MPSQTIVDKCITIYDAVYDAAFEAVLETAYYAVSTGATGGEFLVLI